VSVHREPRDRQTGFLRRAAYLSHRVRFVADRPDPRELRR
jgi:hypothetical protein